MISLARLGIFGLLLLLIGVADAQEPARLAFQGVVPGTTTEAELLKNAAWKTPLASMDQPDGSKLHEFKFGIWPKVTTVVRSGVVRLIDVTPPERAPADKLAEVWELGALAWVTDRSTLPTSVWHGPAVDEIWPILRPTSGSAVLFFAEKDDAKKYVKLVRFFATGDSGSGPPQTPGQYRVLFDKRSYETTYQSQTDKGVPIDVYFYKILTRGDLPVVQNGEQLWGRFVRVPAASHKDQSAVVWWHATWVLREGVWFMEQTERVQVQVSSLTADQVPAEPIKRAP